MHIWCVHDVTLKFKKKWREPKPRSDCANAQSDLGFDARMGTKKLQRSVSMQANTKQEFCKLTNSKEQRAAALSQWY